MAGEGPAAGPAADDDDVVVAVAHDPVPPAAAAVPTASSSSHTMRGVPLRSSAWGARSLPKKSIAQLLNASTRLLPPVIRAACTPSHAAKASLPWSSTPLTWATAAPRPIIAIVPLSMYENGLDVLPARS